MSAHYIRFILQYFTEFHCEGCQPGFYSSLTTYNFGSLFYHIELFHTIVWLYGWVGTNLAGLWSWQVQCMNKIKFNVFTLLLHGCYLGGNCPVMLARTTVRSVRSAGPTRVLGVCTGCCGPAWVKQQLLHDGSVSWSKGGNSCWRMQFLSPGSGTDGLGVIEL